MTNEIQILSLTKKKKKWIVETKEKKYSFHEDTVIKYYLFKDKSFTEEEWKQVLTYEAVADLMEKTLKFLSYQRRSTKEVQKFLSSKTDQPLFIEQVLMKIHQLGYLNDEKYAMEVLDYEKRHQKGPKVVFQKLQQKGLDETLINRVVLNYDDVTEQDILDEVLEKLVQKNQDQPVLKQKNIIMQKLLRDGFSQSLILEGLKKVSFLDKSANKLVLEIEKYQHRYQNLPNQERISKIIKHLMTKGYSYAQIREQLKQNEGE